MRVWLARIFIGLAFSLLLVHNLIAHHHDEQPVAYAGDNQDHPDGHSATPFDNVKLDGDSVLKPDFQHLAISLPVNLFLGLYNFIQEPILIIQPYCTPPPEHPPALFHIDATSLRGPPIYC